MLKALVKYQWWVATWIGLNLADIIISRYLVSHNLGFELMPLASWTRLSIVWKLLMTALVIVLLAKIKKLHLLKPLDVGIGLIVTWNIIVSAI